MLSAMYTSIMGSPQVEVASNVVVDNTSKPTSNSTTYFENMNNSTSSPDIDNNFSSSLSPVKTSRENSMLSDFTDQSLSLSLKNSSESIDLDSVHNQKNAIHYLLDKVSDNEKLLIALAKENKWLNNEVSKLYSANDALAAENVTLREILAAHEQLHRKFAIAEDVNQLWDSFQTFVSNKEAVDSEFAEEMDGIREQIYDMKSTCKSSKDEICVAMVQDFESLDDMMRSVKEKVNANIEIAVEQASTNHYQALRDELKAVQSAVQSTDNLKRIEDEVKAVQEHARRNEIQINCRKGELNLTRQDIIKLEKEITATNQYGRRENLVIDGIPDAVPQYELENTCLEIVQKLGFKDVGCYEVVGCHRLQKRRGDATTPTIIRFTNRKVPEYCKKNRWKLKNINHNNWFLNIREDLCDANQAILIECEKLKKAGKLFKVFTHNGFVKVVKKSGDWPLRMKHIIDVLDLSK